MNIKFTNPSDSVKVSKYSKTVLTEIMKESGLTKIIITSTARTVADQARIMYSNIEKHGANEQKRLYSGYGDKVIDVYVDLKSKGKTRAEIISAMQKKIITLGPSKVSSHVADFSKLNVVDIAPSSIPKGLQLKFEKAVADDSRIKRFFKPPKDPAYHLEITQ
ncbi:MAG: hypothetical protein OEY52_08490 [Gammaproteobacteria bacterium]|nr:hypothetical protein [Gammaproteobacteria bacterium]